MNSNPGALRKIGIFDSGVGGLSVLRALHGLRPDAQLHYLADSGHAPYGDRGPDHVIARSLRVADHLVGQGAGLLVVACNTATAYAIEALRQRHPQLPMVGVEPGVKPAAAMSRTGHIAVLATPGTLASPRFQTLIDRHAPGCRVMRVPCPGLAAAIEQGDAGRRQVQQLLDMFCKPLHGANIDTVVLGCTHYPFVQDEILARLDPGMKLLDTAQAVAQQAMRLGKLHSLPETYNGPWHNVILESTGQPDVLARLARQALGLTAPVTTVDI